MSKRNVFSEVGGLHPRRSVFDLSYEKKLTCDMAQLIPVMCDEVVPGDVFKIGNQAVVRFQPLVARSSMRSICMCIIFLYLTGFCGTIGRILSPAALMDNSPTLSRSGNPQ